VGARGWEEGNAELVFNGYRISIWENRKYLQMNCVDGYTAMQMYLMLQNCTFKMAKLEIFMLYMFYHNKK
jgi:hypothetical protein